MKTNSPNKLKQIWLPATPKQMVKILKQALDWTPRYKIFTRMKLKRSIKYWQVSDE